MSLISKLIKKYFNYVYTPLYDRSTGQLQQYRGLQTACIRKLDLNDKDRLLCIGIGTGNEIGHIMGVNPSVSITGIDYSPKALEIARGKAAALSVDADLRLMDAHRLDFDNGSFNKVLCIHVMDFLDDPARATSEIYRVLSKNGRYVITFPSTSEDMALGYKLFRDNLEKNRANSANRLVAYGKSIIQIFRSTVYLPLLLRPQNESFTKESLTAFMKKVRFDSVVIDENVIYQDLIAYGSK